MKKNADINIQAKRRRMTAIVAAVAAVINAICFVLARMRIPGMHFACYLVLAFSILLVIYLMLWVLSAHEKYSRLTHALRRCFLICTAVAFSAFLILEGFIILNSRTDKVDADCLIILGAGLNGEIPTQILASRMEAAVEYLKTQDDIPVIVSGGQGPNETITEAEAMFRYLISCGIDETRIWKEETSTSTWENLFYSRAVMERKGLDPESIITAVVTNEFHLFRAKVIAGKMGLDVIGIAADTENFGLRTLYYCREACGLVINFLLDV